MPETIYKSKPETKPAFLLDKETGEVLEPGRIKSGIMRLSTARFYNKQLSQPVSLGNWSRLKVYGNGTMVFTLESERQDKDPLEVDKRNQNLITSGEYNGFMSRNTKSQIKKMLCNWMQALKSNSQESKGNPKIKTTFLTLTLSSDQIHTDNEIKRNYLNRFIIELKRKFGVQNYFWRAESQNKNEKNNGRIHFHLIIDNYIDKTAVRELWNKIQSDYVDRYFEKTGKTKAPPSTYIEFPKSLEGLVDYAIKYSLKETPQLSEKGNKTKQTNTFKNEYRKIEGRIWGCSDQLRQIKDSLEFNATEKEEFKTAVKEIYLIDNKEVYTVIGCKFMYLKLNSESLKKLSFIQNKLFLKGKEHFERLYNIEKLALFEENQIKNLDLNEQKRQLLRLNLLEIEKNRRLRNKKHNFKSEALPNIPPDNKIKEPETNTTSSNSANSHFHTIYKALFNQEPDYGENFAACPF